MFKNSLFIILFVTVLTQITFGQAAKSPFSSYGIGELFSPALTNAQGMGGVGIGTPQTYYLNNQNPALLVYNQITTLGAGFVGEQRTVRNSSISEKNSNANLSYLTMAFPIIGPSKKIRTTRWSSSLGLFPYSTVNYKLTRMASLEGTAGFVTVTETGSGGINQVVWSNGVAITRHLSAGITSRYLFGAKIEQFSHYLSQAPVYQPSLYQRERYSDINFQGGLLFHKDSLTSKNFRLNLGLTYDYRRNVKTTQFSRVERLSGSLTVDDDSDTLVNNLVGTTVLPPAVGGGISLSRRWWVIGADVIYTDYRQFKNYSGSNLNAQSTMHYAVGGEIVPYRGTGNNYFSRMIYRAGFSYDDFPFLVGNKPVKDVGINLGIAFPVSGYSSLDIALKVGKQGNIGTNGISENYIKIYFGATLNDRWFLKYRTD
jgi:hypothetical protein